MYDVIEGVDWIFDRYAYLGLEIGASEADIRAAIKRKRVENHEDRLQKSGEEIKQTARRVLHDTEKCAEILLNNVLRPHYDERLRWFQENDNEFINTKYAPIIGLMRETVSLDMLLKDGEINHEKMAEQASLMSQFEPDEIKGIETLFEQMPDNPTIRAEYKKQLSKLYDYYTSLEKLAWTYAGVVQKKRTTSNPMYADADQYVEKVQEAIAEHRDEKLPETVANLGGMIAIGMAEAPLQLTHQDSIEAGKIRDHEKGQKILAKLLKQEDITVLCGDLELSEQDQLRDIKSRNGVVISIGHLPDTQLFGFQVIQYTNTDSITLELTNITDLEHSGILGGLLVHVASLAEKFSEKFNLTEQNALAELRKEILSELKESFYKSAPDVVRVIETLDENAPEQLDTVLWEILQNPDTCKPAFATAGDDQIALLMDNAGELLPALKTAARMANMISETQNALMLAPKALPETEIDRLLNMARDKFTEKADLIIEIAEKKKEIFKKLVELTDFECISQHEQPTGKALVYLWSVKEDDSPIMMCGIHFDEEQRSINHLDKDVAGMSVEEFRALALELGHTVYLIEHNRIIDDFLCETGFVSDQHIDYLEGKYPHPPTSEFLTQQAGKKDEDDTADIKPAALARKPAAAKAKCTP